MADGNSETETSEGQVVDVLLSSWDEVVETFSQYSRGHPWIFRGQEDAGWPLLTRLRRVLEKYAWDNAVMIDWENSAIGFFKRQVRTHLARTPDDRDLVGWLALMQHYGAPTRLLDWTLSPFVACYFALAGENDAPEAVVWALNAYACAREHQGTLFPTPFDHLGIRKHSVTDAEGSTTTTTPSMERSEADRQNDWVRWAVENESKWPLPVFPLAPDARMLAQQSLFTCVGDLRSPIDHLMDKAKWSQVTRRPGHFGFGNDRIVWPADKPSDVVLKFRLDRAIRKQALEGLQLMGITAAALFPGLDGVGLATVLHIESGPNSIQDMLGGGFPF